MSTNKIFSKDILKTQGIIILSPNQKLSEAISKFKSSHDAIIVVNKENKVLGLVTPYYSLIKRVYPLQTKLSNCLFSPPKIYLNTKLTEVARLMLESKVHYLPVINEEHELLGIVTARRLLKTLLNNELAKDKVENLIKGKEYLHTINLSSQFEEVLKFFSYHKFSKLVVVNKDNNLKGIISIFDLLPLFQTPKQRKSFYDRGVDYAKFSKYKIQNFLKTRIVQVNNQARLNEVINLILNKEIGSVIVMKNKSKPINIITTSDLLKYFF